MPAEMIAVTQLGYLARGSILQTPGKTFRNAAGGSLEWRQAEF
jgi:hypothetical protein